MDLTIETVHDIIRIINAYPQWQQEIRDSLFPDIDFPKAFGELAEAQRRTEQSLGELSEAQRRTEQTVSDLSQTVSDLSETVQEMAKENRKSQLLLKHHTTQIARLNSKMSEATRERQAIRDDLTELKHEVKHIRHTQNNLGGRTYEQQIQNRADAVFGRFLKRGRNMRNEIGEYLENAEENGQISDPEHEQVLACNLLWGGKLKRSKQELFLVLEVSWTAEATELERASQRAAILRSIGLNVLPVVAAIQWRPQMAEQALDLDVVMVDDLRLDRETWQAALALVV